MNLPILYSFRRCPYAIRARMALYSAKIKHEHREVDLKNKPTDMLRNSPKGTVPVLILPSNKILEESLDIVYWASTFNNNLMLKNSIQKQAGNLLINENDNVFRHNLNKYKYPERYPKNLNNISYQEQCLEFISKIENNINKKTCFLSDHLNIADIIIFPFVRQFALVNKTWFQNIPFPATKQWFNTIQSSTLLEQVMKKYSPWAEGEPTIIIDF